MGGQSPPTAGTPRPRTKEAVFHPVSPKRLLEPRRRSRLRAITLSTTGAFALGIAVAACGSGPSKPGSTPTSTSAAQSLLAYSSCMRSHGVPNFPDPDSSGGIPKQGVISAEGAVSNSQVQAASSACKDLLPPGQSLSGQPVQTIPVQDEQDYLNAAACMRSHGITNFPEPVFQAGQVEFPMLEHLVDINSPQFMQAYQICRKLIPPGLPDSGSESGSGG
jgi:hypothetical protein